MGIARRAEGERGSVSERLKTRWWTLRVDAQGVAHVGARTWGLGFPRMTFPSASVRAMICMKAPLMFLTPRVAEESQGRDVNHEGREEHEGGAHDLFFDSFVFFVHFVV